MWAQADEPLFDAELFDVDVDPSTVEMVRSWAPDPEEIDPDDIYSSDRVDWIGIQGQMMKLGWDQIHAFPGNPFVPSRVAAFRDIIRDSHDRPLLYAPPVQLYRVSLEDVRDTNDAQVRDELFESHGMSRPFTSGDEELDEFLADEEDFLQTYADDEEDEQTLRSDMLLRSERAIEEQSGDLGKIVAQLRDGNHRSFGAQLAGEDEIWVTVRFLQGPDDMQHLGLREEDFE